MSIILNSITASLDGGEKEALAKAADDIIRFAKAEGLTAHANSIEVRK